MDVEGSKGMNVLTIPPRDTIQKWVVGIPLSEYERVTHYPAVVSHLTRIPISGASKCLQVGRVKALEVKPYYFTDPSFVYCPEAAKALIPYNKAWAWAIRNMPFARLVFENAMKHFAENAKLTDREKGFALITMADFENVVILR